MSPLRSIIAFLLAGVSRIPEETRIEALLAMFAGVLPDMSLEDIALAREQVITRFWTAPDIADPILDLIDGHIALRSLIGRWTLAAVPQPRPTVQLARASSSTHAMYAVTARGRGCDAPWRHESIVRLEPRRLSP